MSLYAAVFSSRRNRLFIVDVNEVGQTKHVAHCQCTSERGTVWGEGKGGEEGEIQMGRGWVMGTQ